MAESRRRRGIDDAGGCGRSRKRRRCFSNGKLLIGQQVEVRSEDDGFCGSWHKGRVVSSDHRKRGVEYDHLLTEDGSRKLVEFLPVSAAMDGFISDDFYDSDGSRRGLIRPVPPMFVFGPWDLHYGLCVDVFYNDGWWEGVVFDHEDGAEYRKVFFPDLGDEQKTACGSESIRITQDWDEKADSWKCRGRWSFLEVIEECEAEWPLVVSVRQIWYDLREKDEFTNFEWTCIDKLMWEKLVDEVIRDNLNIVAVAIPPLLNSSGDSQNDRLKHELPAPEKDVDIHLIPGEGCLDSAVKKPEAMLESAIICDAGTIEVPSVEAFSLELGPLNDPPVVANMESGNDDVSPNSCISVDCAAQTAKILSEEGSISEPLSVKNAHDLGTEASKLIDVGIGMNILDGAGTSFAMETAKILSEEGSISEPLSVKNAHDLGTEASKLIDVGIGMNILDGAGTSFAMETAKRLLEEESSLVPKLPRSLSNMPNVESMTEDLGPHMNVLREVGESIHVRYEFPMSVPGATYTPSLAQSDLKNAETTEEDSRNWKPCNKHFEAKFCPDSVREYVQKTSNESQSSRVRNVRQHLIYLGWRLDYQRDGAHIRIRYTAPRGRAYYSLRPVCDDLLKGAKEADKIQRFPSSVAGPIMLLNPEESQRNERNFLSEDAAPPSPVYSPEAVIDYYKLNLKDRKHKQTDVIKRKRMNAKKHLAAIGWTFHRMEKRGHQVAAYVSPDGKLFQSLVKACEFCMKGALVLCPSDRDREHLELVRVTRDSINFEDLSKASTPGTAHCSDIGASFRQNTGYWTSGSSVGHTVETSGPAHVLRSTKRVREEVIRPNQANPKTLLSWLIDKNVMLPREKLSCRNDACSPTLAVGRVSRLGIKCSCCQTVFKLRAFVNHAGIAHPRPASKIFLADGRSLLNCQLQALCAKGLSCSMKDSGSSRRRSNSHKAENDYICTVCHYGGEILLCDRCPSSFHMECVGLEEVPDGEWFCPTCCCIICNQQQFQQTTASSTDGDILNCQRCERNYHIGCLRAKGSDNPENVSQGRWNCSITCEKMSEDLDRLVEKAIIVGRDSLTWTLLKCPGSEGAGHDAPYTEADVEIRCRLHLALDVMHECFETVKEPFTNSDLVEDVIFNRGSLLPRLNFRGFYTILLERGDELVSVAAVRIYGKRVAEVPLVGTRFHYRRLGMCRILMNTLEKTLKEIGVERLVLPAVPGVLNTWTTSFGFKQMTESERVKFLSYTFLDFQGTIMCCKELQDVPSTERSLPEGTQMTLTENNRYINSSTSKDKDNEGEWFSNTSKVDQAGNDEVGQDCMRHAACKEANGANSLVHEADSGRNVMGEPCAESSSESPYPHHCSSRWDICYQRRRRRRPAS